MTVSEIELLKRRIDREKKARIEAEAILEQKSLELYEANEKLKKSADDLKVQMEKYQTILENASQGIVTVNRDWKIQTVNPAAEKIFRISSDVAIDKVFHQLFAESSSDQISKCFDELETGPQDLVGFRQNGDEFIVELTTSQVRNSNESLLIAMIRDRTSRVQLESQLALAQKLESVGQLAAGIAHEINTPIQFVGDNVQFLADAFKGIEAQLDYCQRLEKEFNSQLLPAELLPNKLMQEKKEHAESIGLDFVRSEIPISIEQSIFGIERVATIVQAMKEFSHPGQSDPIAVDINSALNSTVTVARNEWKYVATIETDYEQELPIVMGFPGDLNQAFLNLIVNAAHAISENGPSQNRMGRISISTKSLRGFVEIRVSDDGCGIEQGQQQKIFEPFFTTKQVGKGTGQGLSIVHSVIAEKHKGKIEVESKVGKGTTFIILLPAA